MNYTSDEYLKDFLAKTVEIFPPQTEPAWLAYVGDITSMEHGYVELQNGDDVIGIYFPADNGKISEIIMRNAEDIVGQIEDLDICARRISSGKNYMEELSYIEVYEEDVSFHYVSTVINTEWEIDFHKNNNGKWCR